MTDPVHVKRVRTPIDNIEYEAAASAGLDPEKTDLVSVSLTDDHQLELTLEGPRSAKE
jgi:hypothetical protein